MAECRLLKGIGDFADLSNSGVGEFTSVKGLETFPGIGAVLLIVTKLVSDVRFDVAEGFHEVIEASAELSAPLAPLTFR